METEKQINHGWAKTFLIGLLQILSLPVVLGGMVLIYELSVPPERSLYNAVMKIKATGDATEIKTVAPDTAKMEQLMQLAVGEIERVNNAYAMYYQAIGQIMPIVYAMEDKVLVAQIETIKDSYGVTKFSANMGDLTSLAGLLLGDPTLAAGSKYARDQREKMAREIKEITQDHRSSIPQDLIRDLPKPNDLQLRGLEFKRLAEEIINDA
ncbi:MAG: hypothetical protein JKX94_00020 [Sneathiella sp.]|nr:hypothetical protein [Sneathiella sp.]